MKKLFSTLIIIAMLASGAAQAAAVTVPEPAKTSVSVTDTKAMEKALLNAKSRIDIPEELTEFSAEAFDINMNNTLNPAQTGYRFKWADKEESTTFYLCTDTEGRILSCNYNKPYTDYNHTPTLTAVPREKAVSLSEELLRKLIPEAYADPADRLVFDSISYSEYDAASFSINFKRMKDGSEVSYNTVHLDANYADGAVTVNSLNIGYDYEAEFEAAAEEIAEPAESYRKVFPEELAYRKSLTYSPRKLGADSEKLELMYHMTGAGYISAYSGEEITPKSDVMPYLEEAAADKNYAGGTADAGMLTAEEQKELDALKGLFSAEDAEKYLRSIPQLKLKDGIQTDGSSLRTETGKNKKYILSINMSNNDKKNYQSVSASFDAQRKRLNYISNFIYIPDTRPNNNAPLTEDEINKGNAVIDSFLNTVISDKLGEFSENEQSGEQRYSVSRSFRRLVNGIPYLNNSISVSYDPEHDSISHYSLSYDDDEQFPSAEKALGADEAYAKLLELAPLTKLYIPTEDGYKLAYTINGMPEIDALTGENLDKENEYDAKKVVYDDISGHWCEPIVNELRENGIALNGESFRPDDAITQEDLLRLFMSGKDGRYMMNISTESLYSYSILKGLIAKEDRNEAAAVTREQAFMIMVRAAGFDRVAQLSDIYKVSYSDGDKLSEGSIGYAAILSGMGVINGDGSELRPQDNITRAEAAAMLYRYLKQN